MTDTPMTPDREKEIRETHPGGWFDGRWTQDYVEAEGGNPAYCRIVHHESGTTLATLPDYAGGIALFIADAHDAVPELLAEVDRLRDRVAELETAAVATLAPHVKHADSPHCEADSDPWPCHAVYVLAPVVCPDGPVARDLRPGAEAARRMIRDRQDNEATP